ATRITDCPARDSDLAWAPDSKHLAYVCDQGAHEEVHVVDVDSHEDRTVTHAGAPESAPRFSPDGKLLAYVRGPGARWLCVEPVAGGEERVVAEGPALSVASWSPDSHWLAFTKRDLANTSDVWVTSLDDHAKPVNVSRYPGTNSQPRWTADGRRIVFVSS